VSRPRQGDGSYSYADGPGNVAQFGAPIGITRDASGVFYVADSDNAVVRTITCP
jgi:hypothetical protein